MSLQPHVQGAGLERWRAKIPQCGTPFYIWCDFALQIVENFTKLRMCGSKILLVSEAKRKEFSRAEPRRLFAAVPCLPSKPSPHRLHTCRQGGGDQSP